MPDPILTILRKQIARLESDRGRVDRQLGAIRGALEALDGAGRTRQAPKAAAPRTRRTMSPAARRAVGKRMKAYWAKRRAENAKGAKSPKSPKSAKK
jgi:hypothetical protein